MITLNHLLIEILIIAAAKFEKLLFLVILTRKINFWASKIAKVND